MTRQIRSIVVDRPGPLINMNDRPNRWDRASANANWRDAAFWWCKQHQLMCRGATSVVEVWFEFGTTRPNQRRDPHNFFPTVKAICDGFTHACVWADDDSKHVHTYEPTWTNELKPTEMKITLSWETPDE